MNVIKKWDIANRAVRKTYPFSLWDKNICVIVASSYQEMILSLKQYLDDAFGESKYTMENKNNIFKISSRNGKMHFKDLEYRNRNENINTNKDVVQTEIDRS